MTRWRNWARTVECRPTEVQTPTTVGEVSDAVKAAAAAGHTVRMTGSGHSFTPAAATSGIMLRPNGLSGVTRLDETLVRVSAGTNLTDLCTALDGMGRALPNMGDIRVQTLAGATATGTHGTGQDYPGLAAGIRALELVLADGSIVEVSGDADPELFESAKVGLGAFGVVTALTLETVPAFLLSAHEFPDTFEHTVDSFDAWESDHDHVEFYWFPHTDRTLVKHNDRHPGPPEPLTRFKGWWDDDFLSNTAFGAMCRAGRSLPMIVPPMNAAAARLMSERSYIDQSWRVFTSPRRVRFVEMEYALPRELLKPALTRLRRAIEDGPDRITFPIEVRSGPSEDTWLGLAHGRATVYIAVHVFQRSPFERYFKSAETIWRDLGGRPHWGKLHTATAEGLSGLYPRFAQVQAVRDRVDPQRRFANDYLARVLGD